MFTFVISQERHTYNVPIVKLMSDRQGSLEIYINSVKIEVQAKYEQLKWILVGLNHCEDKKIG